MAVNYVRSAGSVVANLPGRITNRKHGQDFKRKSGEVPQEFSKIGGSDCVEEGKGVDIYQEGGDKATGENSRGQSQGEDRSVFGLLLNRLFGERRGTYTGRLATTKNPSPATQSRKAVPTKVVR
ncbi:MAG: hypothetical protein U9R38_02425 [Candidatus Margulisiibacteriota bacterium]|nr:hypothetical protein [Candidatus Margulisiibacteriota bacterium]